MEEIILRFIISDKDGLEVVITLNESGVVVSNEGNYISEIVNNILDKKELRHQSEVESFPSSMVRRNENGVFELDTESYEYLHEYLPPFLKSFDLTVVEKE